MLNQFVIAGGTALEPWTPTPVLDPVYAGAPSIGGSDVVPFIHLPWNNAPYANPYEIMQVPASAPGRFGVEFVDSAGMVNVGLHVSNSMGTGGIDPVDGSRTSRFGAEFEIGTPPTTHRIGHLLNFFPPPDPSINPTPTLRLDQFLEYVCVPSRFVGTRYYLDTTTSPPVTISSYREPGKVNINTASVNVNPAMLSAWNAVCGDRESTGINLSTIRGMDFETPFCAANGGLVRTHVISGSATGQFEPDLQFGSTVPNSNIYLNTYNELEGIQRLSNLTTNRSNAFAVWVTVGYFEATKVNPTDYPGLSLAEFDAIYPGGYTIGKELGSDVGEIVRHRAFYIVDRTIPVGFRRGNPMNAMDAVLLKRVLE